MISYQKQADHPLFPDIFWNQPVSTHAQGSIVVLGGHGQHFALTQQIHHNAKSAGAGRVRFLMPDAIQKLIGATPEGVYLPSTPSGSFAVRGTDQAVAAINDFDGLIISDDISNNSETIRFLEHVIQEVDTTVMIAGDTLVHLLSLRDTLQKIDVVILSPQQLSEWGKAEGTAIYTKGPNLQKELPLLVSLGEAYDATIVVTSAEHTLVASSDEISMTAHKINNFAQLQANVGVFAVQHANRFKSATSAVYASRYTH